MTSFTSGSSSAILFAAIFFFACSPSPVRRPIDCSQCSGSSGGARQTPDRGDPGGGNPVGPGAGAAGAPGGCAPGSCPLTRYACVSAKCIVPPAGGTAVCEYAPDFAQATCRCVPGFTKSCTVAGVAGTTTCENYSATDTRWGRCVTP
jgi:hypothetical protein